MRAGNREHIGEACTNNIGFLPHAASDDHAAIFGHCFADCLKALFLGTVQEAAGVDQHNVSPCIISRHRIAIGAQLGQDAFAIH